MSIHIALVIGIDTPETNGARQAAAEQVAARLSREGAYVQRLITPSAPAQGLYVEPATQVNIYNAVNNLVAGAVSGAQVTLYYIGDTIYNASRGTLLKGSDTPDGWAMDMWSIDEVRHRFKGCAGPLTIVVNGRSLDVTPITLPEEVEWNPDETGVRVFEIRSPANALLGYVVLTGGEYEGEHFDPSTDYWFWTSGSPWPDHFKLKWSNNQEDDERFDSLTPTEVYPLHTFAAETSAPPANPSGKLYRFSRVVNGSPVAMDLYLHHTGSGSNATTEWWALQALLSNNFIIFPEGDIHLVDKISAPPANLETDRRIATQTSA